MTMVMIIVIEEGKDDDDGNDYSDRSGEGVVGCVRDGYESLKCICCNRRVFFVCL